MQVIKEGRKTIYKPDKKEKNKAAKNKKEQPEIKNEEKEEEHKWQ